MDLIAALPEWLVWAAAGAVGAFALAIVARALCTCLDLDGG
jgi:NADPH:quinone reductase-like Zn-dependent oxidoreductase